MKVETNVNKDRWNTLVINEENGNSLLYACVYVTCNYIIPAFMIYRQLFSAKRNYIYM